LPVWTIVAYAQRIDHKLKPQDVTW
jgi:hypothetical protein